MANCPSNIQIPRMIAVSGFPGPMIYSRIRCKMTSAEKTSEIEGVLLLLIKCPASRGSRFFRDAAIRRRTQPLATTAEPVIR